MRGPWDWGAERPKARRARLERGVTGLTGSSDQLRSVFIASRGLRPGLEFLAPVAVLLNPNWLVTPNVLLSMARAGGVVAAAMLALELVRRHYVVAITDERVLIFRSTWRHQLDAKRLERTMPTENAITYDDGRKGRVYIGGRRYWVTDVSQDEARRATQDSGRTPS